MKSIILFILIVAVVYIVLKKATIYRCLNCSSIHITKGKDKSINNGNIYYTCSKCGCNFTRNNIIDKGENL